MSDKFVAVGAQRHKIMTDADISTRYPTLQPLEGKAPHIAAMSIGARMRSPQDAPKKAQGNSKTVAADEVTALKDAVVAVLEDYKAVDITVLTLAGQASFADYMIVASGTSTRHVASMGGAIDDRLGKEVLGMEGRHEGEWVCVDMGAVVVHLFLPEKRTLYNLEKLWSHVFEASADSD